MHEKFEFVNVNNLPLGELNLQVKKDGISTKIPALSEHWVQPKCYTKYRSLTITEGKIISDASLEEWINEAEYFNKDLENLLILKHFRFWSNLIHDKECINSITSFLQEATPHYLNFPSLTDDKRVIEIYHQILSNVLRIICRMITNKESDDEWIAKDHLNELLYSNFLISIPMIFDLIIAYGRTNIGILSKIVQTIFIIEPKYNEDLKISLKFYQNTLKVIQKQVENDGICDENFSISSSYDDIALYTLDCATTLSILLEIHSDAKYICAEIQMEQSVSNFYDNTISLLYKNIFTSDAHSSSLEVINQARMEFIKAFRLMVAIHIESVFKQPEQSILPAEKFIAILTECLADRTFVIDYQKYYPVENDIDVLKQACKELDVFKADFILKAYSSEGGSYLEDIVGEDSQEINANIDTTTSTVTDNSNIIHDKIQNLAISRDMDTEIIAVRDVLPYLGDGFVRRLLVRYDNPELVVAAVLEGNLPPDLATADQTEVYIPPDPQDTVYMQTGIKRFNVFDGDQYDIMTQDNPNCIIKSGKGFPGQPKNMTQLLDDKSHIQALKHRYAEYNLVSEYTGSDNECEYDDEYDDSYEALADSETKAKRTISKISRNDLVDEIEDEDDDNASGESNDESLNNNGRDTSKDFCENPEITRARYEAKRMAKMASRGGGGHRPNQGGPPKDFVGQPKGQGQDKKVLMDRHKKDVHKSSRANHNRKSGASWKRNKGMIPS